MYVQIKLKSRVERGSA